MEHLVLSCLLLFSFIAVAQLQGENSHLGTVNGKSVSAQKIITMSSQTSGLNIKNLSSSCMFIVVSFSRERYNILP